jgi:hypothetical protein
MRIQWTNKYILRIHMRIHLCGFRSDFWIMDIHLTILSLLEPRGGALWNLPVVAFCVPGAILRSLGGLWIFMIISSRLILIIIFSLQFISLYIGIDKYAYHTCHIHARDMFDIERVVSTHVGRTYFNVSKIWKSKHAHLKHVTRRCVKRVRV